VGGSIQRAINTARIRTGLVFGWTIGTIATVQLNSHDDVKLHGLPRIIITAFGATIVRFTDFG
ncbi:MAG TPA: hypothetical protein VFK73_01390, partial [Paludibacter sp.]|nr:hypothetical protein [Paludibacter sp.]